MQSAAPAALLAAAAHGHARLLEDLARETAVRDLLPQARREKDGVLRNLRFKFII